jgi:tripartite-type tricarboxylate transporter receptor subunit TctC
MVARGAATFLLLDTEGRARSTFGVMNNSQLTIAKMLNPAIRYDPARDLTPVALIGTAPMVLVVDASAVGKTPHEWLGLAPFELAQMERDFAG